MSVYLGSQVANARTQRAPLGLQRDRLNATLAHAIRDLVETRQRSGDVPAWAAPEELSRRRGARPGDGVEVLRTRLLRPEKVLTWEKHMAGLVCWLLGEGVGDVIRASHDEFRLGVGEIGGGVEGVRFLPCLERVTPRVADHGQRSAVHEFDKREWLTQKGSRRPSHHLRSPKKCN